MPETSERAAAVRHRVRHPLVRRRLTVLSSQRLSARLLRLTVGGEELDGFTAPGPADHVKLFVPDPRTGELHLPNADAPPAVPPTVRDYTPRAHRPGELDIDVVLHPDPGPVSAFAERARPGDPLAIGGPRGSVLLPTGVDHLLLGGDETALPALARWLEMAPDDVEVDVLLEVSDADDAAYLEAAAGPSQRVHALYRDGQGPGTTTLLHDAIRSWTPRSGPGYAWFAGEAGSLVPVRRWLRGEDSPYPRTHVGVDGYWKRGVVALDHHAPLDPDDPE